MRKRFWWREVDRMIGGMWGGRHDNYSKKTGWWYNSSRLTIRGEDDECDYFQFTDFGLWGESEIKQIFQGLRLGGVDYLDASFFRMGVWLGETVCLAWRDVRDAMYRQERAWALSLLGENKKIRVGAPKPQLPPSMGHRNFLKPCVFLLIFKFSISHILSLN